ncbi:NAD(P)H nitroreductase [Mycobacterium sp. IS-1496]|uniref:Acg family FMN-binding oxidoreductase n=1 Tax=Mycobacterium sp. IS-1496 TaxID=1772284 RepID=UPI0007416C18|nr:hypothetical protein [Mycobacterium sp. IS-1496]KUI33923.1 NAD(P)H nitroreductase [Mycobacterium sp. IS-1496]
MTVRSPGADTLRTALSLANRAPSIHNSQPWHWQVGTHSVHLYADQSLQLAHTDPDARELIVSCGAALNHCAVALTALGWPPKIHRLPNPAEPSHLASLELHSHTPSESDIALAAAIPRRRTDRRHFSDWPVSMGDIALMGSRAARAGVTMRRVEMTPAFRAALALAVGQHAADPDYAEELAAWTGRHASTVGVPARNSPASDPAAAVPARWFAGTALKQPAGAEASRDSGVVVALGTATDDVMGRLRAGEAASLVMLTATTLGLATCPITEPLEIRATREAIRDDVFDDLVYPQILLRVGWAPVNADPLPATPRRPLGELATWLDGSVLV